MLKPIYAAMQAVRKPPKRPGIPPRNADNNKRKLDAVVSPERITRLQATVTYNGSSKHKRNPHIFGLPPYRGDRGDATLCDEHANMQPADMVRIPAMIDRSLRAGLIGTNIWAVGDDGWIFQGSRTN